MTSKFALLQTPTYESCHHIRNRHHVLLYGNISNDGYHRPGTKSQQLSSESKTLHNKPGTQTHRSQLSGITYPYE
ncbi:hypothetical protein Hanom_Chr12g01084521 [Helianthus anomalus]